MKDDGRLFVVNGRAGLREPSWGGLKWRHRHQLSGQGGLVSEENRRASRVELSSLEEVLQLLKGLERQLGWQSEQVLAELHHLGPESAPPHRPASSPTPKDQR